MEMNLPPVVVLLLSVAISLGIGSALVISAMIGEVNRRLPEDQQISYLFGYPGKMEKIKAEYKRFYPKGNLLRVLTILTVLMFTLMAACALIWGVTTHNLGFSFPAEH